MRAAARGRLFQPTALQRPLGLKSQAPRCARKRSRDGPLGRRGRAAAAPERGGISAALVGDPDRVEVDAELGEQAPRDRQLALEHMLL